MRGVPQVTVKTIEALIDRACQNDLKGPNLELNLAIIDTLKAHPKYERHAAFYMLGYINGLYGPPALLALSLLDGCVINLGFSFQYVIGTKEFLNKLVWKFPVDAPKVKHQVMEKILYLIHKWHHGIASYGPYTYDLANIRAMHKLLVSKGYRFPHVPTAEIAIMTPCHPLQTKKEMEQQREMIHNVRLKELLRRGKPEDLKAANELIKEMTGYDPENRPDYMFMIEQELASIKNKAEILGKLIGSNWKGIDHVSKDVAEHKTLTSIYSYCKQAYEKTKKLLSDPNLDEFPLEALQDLDDTLSRVLNRYESPNQVQASEPDTNAVSDQGQICLLDLDVDTFSNAIQSQNSSMTDLRIMSDIIQEHPNLPKELTELMDLRFHGNLLK
jgi:ADP-ribosylation factor-binding protein GGA